MNNVNLSLMGYQKQCVKVFSCLHIQAGETLTQVVAVLFN